MAAAGAVLADQSWKSVIGHRGSHLFEREFEAGPALTNSLVLVVFDGLRRDRAPDLPAFQALAEHGASGLLEVVQPSLSGPSRAALATGAPPAVNGVTNNGVIHPSPVQSLFSLARRSELEVAVFGISAWSAAFGEHIPAARMRRPARPRRTGAASGAEFLAFWQAEMCDDALRFHQATVAQFRIVDLLGGDEAGHDFGGASQEYRDVTAVVDDCLARLVSELGGAGSTILAVSDHGHIDRRGQGGHGGAEPEVLFAPFAAAGPGIRRSPRVEAHLVDIAPTISMLLGLPIPANSQGRVLWEALDVPLEHEADFRALAAEQREALQAHLPDREASQARLRRGRLPISLATGMLFAVVLVGSIWRRTMSLALACTVFAVAYYALFYAFGLGYSLSAIVKEEYLNWFFLRNVVAAVLAYWLASLCLARCGERNWEAPVRLSLVLTSGLGLMVAFTHYRYGLLMREWMLELGAGFKAYLDMLAIIGIVVGTLLLLAARMVSARRTARAA